MCFHYAYISDKIETAKRYGITNPPEFEAIPHANAFGRPKMPIITNEQPEILNFYNWGLIPSWIKSINDANSISKKTVNARSETIFEKPSYRDAIKRRRCLIPSTGFYEWRHEGKEKIKHLVQTKDQKIFSFAGIYETWTNKQTGEKINTYSMLTMEANDIMKYVHNNRERMPVILHQEDEKYWLSDLKNKDEIYQVIKKYSSEYMLANVVD